jgi:nucleotide-binding universal stress UspA family protein
MPTVRKVLVAVDFSETSDRVLRYGTGMAWALGAEAMVVHAVVPPSGYLPLDRSLWGDDAAAHALMAQVDEAARREIDAFMARQPDEIRSSVPAHLRTGRADQAILAEAKERQADIIVLGVRGKDSVQRPLLGAVATKIMRQASCPVLLVP